MHKKLLRWMSWSIPILASLLLVAVVGIWFYTQTDHFRSFLRAQLLTALNDSLNGEVKFKDFTGSVWEKMQLRDVAILQDGNLVLSAPSVSIELGLFGQLYALISSSTIHVARIEIAGPELCLAQDQDKNWNVMTLLKKGEKPSRLTIVLDKLKIENGKIEVTAADGKKAHVSALSAEGGLGLLPLGFEADLDKLDFALSSAGIPNTNWSSALSVQQDPKNSLFTIKRLNVATPESRLNISGTVSEWANPTAKLTIELIRGSAKEITRLLPVLPLRQDISARVRASGPLSALEISGALSAGDGQLTGSMVTDWTKSEPRLQGKLEFKEFVVDKVLTVAGVKGKVNGQLDFQGSSFEQAQASARSRVSGLVVEGWEIGEVAFSGQLKDKTVAFAAQSDLKGGKTELKGNLVLAETLVYDVALEARSLDLKKAAVNPADIPAGNVNLDAWIKGLGTEPKTMQLDIQLKLYPSEIGNIRIKQGRVEGSLRNGTVTLREARLEADSTTLIASGTIPSVTQGIAGNMTYVLNFREISPWLKLAGLEGSGRARVDGTVSGSLQTPRLEGRATINELRVSDARVDSGNVRWTLAASGSDRWHGQLRLTAKQVTAGVSLSSVDANFVLDGMRPATVDVEIVARDPDQRVHQLKGRLVRSDERADVLLQDLSFQLPDGTWRNPRPARLTLIGKNLTVEDFQLQRDSQRVTVKGTTGWQGAQDLSVEVSRFPLADLRTYLLKEMPAVTGDLSLAMQIKGTAAQPLIGTTMNVDKLSVAGQQYAGVTAQGSYEREQLKLDLRLLQDSSHSLNVNGTLPVYLGWGEGRALAVLGETNLRIHSDGLSPSFLSVLSQDIDNLQGSLSMDIIVRGPLRSLAPSGTIQFQNGGVRVRALAISLTDIGLQANVTPSAIHISRLAARSGPGQLDGTGQLSLKGQTITAVALALNAQDFQVIDTREYKASASGKLLASGTLDNPYVRGALTVKGTLRPNVALLKRTGLAAQDSTIVVARKESELAAAEQKSKRGNSAEENSLYRRLGLDITATIAPGTWIYLDEGSIETIGQLRVQKQPADILMVTGNIQGLNGSYTFQGRRFQIEKAAFVFAGGSQIDPSLDIVARYRAPQYLIDLVVGGTMNKPTLTLRSDPTLDQSDILAVLLFGRPTATLNQSQQTALKGQAAKLAADFIASDLKQSVARNLGLDIIDFDVGQNPGQGKVGVGIGKYITQDVFVGTRQEFGNEKQQEYSIEYNVTPNWQIKSSASPYGNTGIDIFWRKQY